MSDSIELHSKECQLITPAPFYMMQRREIGWDCTGLTGDTQLLKLVVVHG